MLGPQLIISWHSTTLFTGVQNGLEQLLLPLGMFNIAFMPSLRSSSN